jgi:hypothetical protein
VQHEADLIGERRTATGAVGGNHALRLILLSRKTPVSFRNSACPDAMVVW